MSANNGVIRIGRKGTKKFAFGEDGAPFEVDVVQAFQQWIGIEEQYRQQNGDKKGKILQEDMAAYHQGAVEFVKELSTDRSAGADNKQPDITIAEALDFIARLGEQYNELADFFLIKRREKDESLGTSGVELRFSAEEEPSPTSTN